MLGFLRLPLSRRNLIGGEKGVALGRRGRGYRTCVEGMWEKGRGNVEGAPWVGGA